MQCAWRRCIYRTPIPKLVCNFDFKDTPRPGRPVEPNEGSIKALSDANRRITTREIAERLTLSN